MRKPVIMSSLSFLLLIFSISTLMAQQHNITSFSISDSPWSPAMNQTLLSSDSTFAAGFRPLPNSPQLYIFAIWCPGSLDNTIVWSLGTSSPLNQSSSLVITPAGNLQLTDSAGNILWQPTASGDSNQTALTFGRNGDLKFGNWNSFNSPTATFVTNQIVNSNRTLISKNGKYKLINGQNLVFNSSNYYYRLYPAPIRTMNSNGTFTFQDSTEEPLMADFGSFQLRRLTLDDDGNLRVYSLQSSSGTWTIVWQRIQELCTVPGVCDQNYICMPNGYNSTYCVCPSGFEEKTGADGEQICQRKIPLTATDSKFLRLDFVSFNGGERVQAPNFTSCENGCLVNPNCVGYSVQLNGQQNCYCYQNLLFGYWSPGTETTTFLRLSNSETSVSSNFTGITSKANTICTTLISLPLPPNQSKTTTRNIVILSIVFLMEFIVGFLSFWAFRKRYLKYQYMAWMLGFELLPTGGPKRFSYLELKEATNNFSNVIGQGGFGIVYKGELPDHRSIAVKCLKKAIGGESEFWGEIIIIARMHHLNLIRIWGFCVEKGHRMLVYEYITNGSLAKYLFPDFPASQGKSTSDSSSSNNISSNGNNTDQNTQLRPLLDWNIRYRIAVGVARAIAYLHEECLEWVLHCDIKPENILLGEDFCPKVSDFGVSKLTEKKDKVAMSRIHGTRGYLAPEWVTREPITAKADVYSFGMVLLEIVSGIRSTEFHQNSSENEQWYFPRWSFEKVYEENMMEDLLDKRVKHSYDSKVHFELVDRMVKTAMWCLQYRAELRPSMGKVAKMLEGTVEIAEPAKPTFLDG